MKKEEWTCPRCKRKVAGNECECGINRARSIYNGMLMRLLAEKTRSGHTTWEVMEKWAYSYAHRKNIPLHLVEDAFCKALERIVNSMDKYDPCREFRTWAIAFIRNEIRTAVKKDMKTAGHLSLDEETEDGELVAEAIEGDSLTIEDIIIPESKKEREKAQKRIARAMLGEYKTGYIYDVAVEIFGLYQEEGKDNPFGWVSLLSAQTGVDRSVINSRRKKAAEMWERSIMKSGGE